jgi:hypothetical protein
MYQYFGFALTLKFLLLWYSGSNNAGRSRKYSLLLPDVFFFIKLLTGKKRGFRINLKVGKLYKKC